MKNQNKPDVLDEIDADIASADGLMLVVLVLVVMGGLLVAGVSALIGAL